MHACMHAHILTSMKICMHMHLYIYTATSEIRFDHAGNTIVTHCFVGRVSLFSWPTVMITHD